jgi:uncharacterized protein
LKQKTHFIVTGAVAGLLNGLFGAGGGVAVVPLLEHAGIEARKSHATSIAIIAALSVVSAAFYLFNGKFDFWQALPYLPFGLVGAVVGAKLLPKIPNKLLKRIFGGVMILSAIRLLLR